MKPLLPVVDCFAGAGGLSLGLHAAGLAPVFAFDLDRDACATYERNSLGPIECTDFSKVTVDSVCTATGREPGDFALVCGGPPCQGFSTQRRGERTDARNDLVTGFAELATALRPQAILLENVPGLLGVRGKSHLRRAFAQFELAGYEYDYRVLNAADFGVPQVRMRAFVVAWDPTRCSPITLPKAAAGAAWRTVRDAIGDMPEPAINPDQASLPNHVLVKMSSLNIQRISFVPEGGGRLDVPLELQLPCHRHANGHRHLDVYGRMRWDAPAPTITAMFDNFTRGRFAHPSEDRSITGREGARLQTFPDSYQFLGDKKSVARQIGNAVPPSLATELGKAILTAVLREPSRGPSQLRMDDVLSASAGHAREAIPAGS